ncbi:MAG: hypothetical protein QM538_01480 [Methylacidiphilales bacterium]|nr:hypothetical protein [Candidatus Methylacidiphilales bacterium]
MSTGNTLLIIDPQIDFCDIPPQSIGGWQPKLEIKGANQCMLTLAKYIKNNLTLFDSIYISLDTHQYIDISHTVFWQDADGVTPPPFTLVTYQDLQKGKYLPKMEKFTSIAASYLQALELKNKYMHTLWPPHALIGSVGNCVHPELHSSILCWELSMQKNAHYIQKGLHPFTEHFSVFCSEVPDPTVPETMHNEFLLNKISNCNKLFVAGLASSHCLKSSVEDLQEYFFTHKQITCEKILLSDTTCPVAGFEELEKQLYSFLKDKNWQLARCDSLVA